MIKLIAAVLSAVFSVLALVGASAMAASHSPTGENARFGECPLNRATITDCVYSLSRSGRFTIGKKSVPVVNPIRIQGGFEGAGKEIDFYGAENGDTISRAPQPVPGGLAGVTAPGWWPEFLQDWFNDEIENDVTAVRATVELTGPAKGLTDIDLNTESLFFEEGTALGLPAKFRLENPLLGSNCYLGWESDPVQINLTSGTNGSLKGRSGKSSFNKAFTVTTVSDGRLVNNSFEVPRARGCGGIYSFFLDPLVDSILGLPTSSGENLATLEGDFLAGNAEAVKASE
jgi:hypothetical protein